MHKLVRKQRTTWLIFTACVGPCITPFVINALETGQHLRLLSTISSRTWSFWKWKAATTLHGESKSGCVRRPWNASFNPNPGWPAYRKAEPRRLSGLDAWINRKLRRFLERKGGFAAFGGGGLAATHLLCTRFQQWRVQLWQRPYSSGSHTCLPASTVQEKPCLGNISTQAPRLIARQKNCGPTWRQWTESHSLPRRPHQRRDALCPSE